MKALRIAILASLTIFTAAQVEAFPLLQLDVLSGQHDEPTGGVEPTDETVIGASDPALVALLTGRDEEEPTDFFGETPFVSAAIFDPISSATGRGLFNWTGQGASGGSGGSGGGGGSAPSTPPGHAGIGDPGFGGTPDEGILPPFFQIPSGLPPTSETTNPSYFATFNVTSSQIAADALHFDLYSSLVDKCSSEGGCALDDDIGTLAPPPNTQTEPQRVAEPQSLLLMSTGLLLAGRMLRRSKK